MIVDKIKEDNAPYICHHCGESEHHPNDETVAAILELSRRITDLHKPICEISTSIIPMIDASQQEENEGL